MPSSGTKAKSKANASAASDFLFIVVVFPFLGRPEQSAKLSDQGNTQSSGWEMDSKASQSGSELFSVSRFRPDHTPETAAPLCAGFLKVSELAFGFRLRVSRSFADPPGWPTRDRSLAL